MSHELTATELLARIPYLAPLPEQARQAVLQAWQRRTAPAGTLLFTEGEASAGLHALAAGRVRIFKLSPDGKEQGLHLLGPGDTFNDIAALDGGPNPASALALEDCVLYRLGAGELLDLMAHHPVLAQSLVASLAGRVRFLVNKVEELAFHTVAARLARLLLEQAELNDRAAGVRVTRHRWLTQQEMAAQLGTVREVVGRILRQFAREGLIVLERRQIVLRDTAGLRAVAEGL